MTIPISLDTVADERLVQPVASPAIARDNVALGSLRTFVTVLVVLFHACLGYAFGAPEPARSLLAEPRTWAGLPVIDAQRSKALALFVVWPETWFMSLMFLISGLFVWSSLTRKGEREFVRDRVLRLGVPFALSVCIAPLAFVPTYLAAIQHGAPQPGSFVAQWLALGDWPTGPAWFLWVLLVYGVLAALAYRLAPGWGSALGRWSARTGQKPALFGLALLSAAALVYVPLAGHFAPETWKYFGPFSIQTSRSLSYAVYFVAGIGLGAAGLDQGLLAPGGRLARRWWAWSAGGLLSFVIVIALLLAIVGAQQASVALKTAGNIAVALCCTCNALAVLAIFLRFARGRPRWLASLSANAYGIYVLHYVCVAWLQLALLDRPLDAPLKAVLVFGGALAASWSASALLRRVPGLARVL